MTQLYQLGKHAKLPILIHLDYHLRDPGTRLFRTCYPYALGLHECSCLGY